MVFTVYFRMQQKGKYIDRPMNSSKKNGAENGIKSTKTNIILKNDYFSKLSDSKFVYLLS